MDKNLHASDIYRRKHSKAPVTWDQSSTDSASTPSLVADFHSSFESEAPPPTETPSATDKNLSTKLLPLISIPSSPAAGETPVLQILDLVARRLAGGGSLDGYINTEQEDFVEVELSDEALVYLDPLLEEGACDDTALVAVWDVRLASYRQEKGVLPSDCFADVGEILRNLLDGKVRYDLEERQPESGSTPTNILFRLHMPQSELHECLTRAYAKHVEAGACAKLREHRDALPHLGPDPGKCLTDRGSATIIFTKGRSEKSPDSAWTFVPPPPPPPPPAASTEAPVRGVAGRTRSHRVQDQAIASEDFSTRASRFPSFRLEISWHSRLTPAQVVSIISKGRGHILTLVQVLLPKYSLEQRLRADCSWSVTIEVWRREILPGNEWTVKRTIWRPRRAMRGRARRAQHNPLRLNLRDFSADLPDMPFEVAEADLLEDLDLAVQMQRVADVAAARDKARRLQRHSSEESDPHKDVLGKRFRTPDLTDYGEDEPEPDGQSSSGEEDDDGEGDPTYRSPAAFGSELPRSSSRAKKVRHGGDGVSSAA